MPNPKLAQLGKAQVGPIQTLEPHPQIPSALPASPDSLPPDRHSHPRRRTRQPPRPDAHRATSAPARGLQASGPGSRPRRPRAAGKLHRRPRPQPPPARPSPGRRSLPKPPPPAPRLGFRVRPPTAKLPPARRRLARVRRPPSCDSASASRLPVAGWCPATPASAPATSAAGQPLPGYPVRRGGVPFPAPAGARPQPSSEISVPRLEPRTEPKNREPNLLGS